MNGAQRKILLIALVVWMLSELFPPWQYEDEQTSARRPAGYHFISRPPAAAPYEKMKKIFSIPDRDPPHYIRSRRDKAGQSLQRLALPFLTFGLLLLACGRQTFFLRVTGILSLIIAGGLACLLVYHTSTF